VILLIDNYDSFVYNLARYVRELGHEAIVRRHDALSLSDISALAPSHIIISPGPCTPREAGISTDVVRQFAPSIPILGVCLGHQCIGAAFGGNITRAVRPMHGKVSVIHHQGAGIFKGLPSPFRVTRYHSLIIEKAPDELRVTAWSETGEIMAVEHREYSTIGVQFHPESALTEYGYRMLSTFLTGQAGRPGADLPDRADGAFSRCEPAAFIPPPVELVR
jgi:anthranilate synthase/aminodeoxychorismate synthase-like glutamine amidotransferase